MAVDPGVGAQLIGLSGRRDPFTLQVSAPSMMAAPDSTESVLELAEELQRTLLPALPPELFGAQIAFRYLPSNDITQVGGDWFDALALPGKRIGLVVGDVMGHGVASAAIMGQLRTAVQTLAFLGLPPDELMRHLDEGARRLSDTHLATCLYGIYDPVSRRFTAANAGHPPPVLVRPGQGARLVEMPSGVPIGVGGHAFGSIEFDLEDGDVLVFYTDGLVECPNRDITEGLRLLCEILSDLDEPLERSCDVVMERMATGRYDDAALLMARFHGIGRDRVAGWALEPGPQAPGQARLLVRRTLARWGLTGPVETAELLASELVTNATRYASRPIGLRLLHTDTLTCECHDDNHNLPALSTDAGLSDSGRGLVLVNALADRWGANRTDSGKVVWFELGAPGAVADPPPFPPPHPNGA